jgi:hypothetical protein
MQEDDRLWRSTAGSPPGSTRSPAADRAFQSSVASDGIKAIAVASTQALHAALTMALRTTRNEPKAASSYLHKALAARSGAGVLFRVILSL